MDLKTLLTEKRTGILKKWFDLILETYPTDTANFMKSQKDRFANPVGSTIMQGIEGVYDQLLNGADLSSASPFLDNIIKVRAIQEFTPAKALSFIFLLKNVIREELATEIREKNISDDLLSLESNIDTLALFSFDIYMQCREKLYEIRANEVKNNTFRLLQRAKMVCEVQDNKLNLEEKNN